MAAKTDKKPVNPLPVNTDDLTPSSNITYNNEVVAIIAGLAANEVEGIAGMCTVSSGLKNKSRNVTLWNTAFRFSGRQGTHRKMSARRLNP